MALGSVSVPTFTRAEIDTMLKKAMYSDGKVVWTGSVYTDGKLSKYESSSVSIPDEVDYISVAGVKMVRGDGYSTLSGIANASVGSNKISITCRVTFDSSGKLTVYGCGENIRSFSFNVTGYHYY